MKRNKTDSAENAEYKRFLKWLRKKFPTDLDCWEKLIQGVHPNGFHCAKCELRLHRKYGERSVKCRKCGVRYRVLAKSLFKKIRKPRPWLAAIYFTAYFVAISANQFSKLLGIASSTAQSIFQRIRMVAYEHLTLAVEIPSQLFSEAICKRSRQTPACAHPTDEILQDVSIEPVANSPAGDDSIEEEVGCEKAVYSLIPIEPISFDQLCCLSELPVGKLSAALISLELAGLVKRGFGDYFERATVNSPPQNPAGSAILTDELIKIVDEITEEFISTIRTIFHGISRKNLSLYLAWFSCLTDKEVWVKCAIFELCCRSRPIEARETNEFVSPQLLKLPITKLHEKFRLAS